MVKSAPKAPDPFQTAQAQAGANKEAVQESAKVSAVDQFAPWGSTTFDRDEETGVPTSQTIKLGSSEQGFYDLLGGIRNSLAGKAQDFTGFLPRGKFEGIGDGAGDKVANALFERRLGMIQPELDKADNALRVSLGERGIPVGAEIYDKEMNRLDRNRRDTLSALSNDAILASGGEEDRQLANALTMRAQPLNEISAFLQGSPAVPTPGFQGNPAYQISPPDISGLVTADYQNRLGQYNQRQGSLMDGLFGLGSAALSLSDARLKDNVRRIGQTDSGVPIYTFEYSLNPGITHVGVMAQELREIIPEAVVDLNGILMVDYRKVR